METAAAASPEWLFFDVGFTLLDETAAWQDQFERLAHAIFASDPAIEVARMWRSFQSVCVNFAPRQWRAVVEAHSPRPADVERLMRLGDGWRHDLERPYPGVCETLKTLAATYKLGIIANQSAGTRERLRSHGLLESISLVIGSAEAGVTKPDPAIFLQALSEAGCTADRAVMIGDRLDNDIRPANLLGMRTIHVRQGGSGAQVPRDASERPTFSVGTIPEILALVPEIRA